MINTKSFDTTLEMVQRCNQLWASQTPEEAASAAAAAAAGPWQHSSLRVERPPPQITLPVPPGGDKAGDKADRRRCSPTPGAARGGRNDGLCFYHSRFGNKAHKCERGCTYQKN
jgi:hypothetical protein